MRATVVRMEDAFSQSPESFKCRFHNQFKYPVGALSDLFCGESTNQMEKFCFILQFSAIVVHLEKK